ncbi:MAG: hypothetical protein ABSG78_01070 [Verrucomicrobiota bacterium]|jgi:hypothetical protein
MNFNGLGLKQQILLAAFELTTGDLNKTFTAEELLVHGWKNDNQAWGLRGFEDTHPDSSKLFKELDAHAGKQGIVGEGLLEKVHRRVFRLTTTGLAEVSALRPSDAIAREKADRRLEQDIKQIIEHPVFKDWLNDPSRPKYFREAGHFWGVAPGTPAKTVLERVSAIDRTLTAALKALDTRGTNEFIVQRGKVLFERKDIERCLEFQSLLLDRFERDLKVLAPEFAR